MTVNFDQDFIEEKFKEAADVLLDPRNVSIITYEKFNHETFDVHNKDFLNDIAQKPIVYCIWTGKTNETLEYKYIGHVGKQYSRQRLRNHLTKKTQKDRCATKKYHSCSKGKTCGRNLLCDHRTALHEKSTGGLAN